MATANQVNSMLTVSFDGGVDTNGKTTILKKRFNGIKPTATNDQLYSVVQALAPLQNYTVIHIERDNTIDISA